MKSILCLASFSRGCLFATVLFLVGTALLSAKVFAQPFKELIFLVEEEDILDMDRPRIAAGADGSFAVALEIFTQGQFEARPTWKIGVQRFSPQGVPVGPWNVFKGESCSSLDIWTNDWMEHAELAFRPDGILVVLMQHAGRFSLGGVDDVASAEVTIGAVDLQGQIIKLSDRVDCVQHKLIFPGARRQDRPRMAIAPNAAMLVVADGFFDRSDFRNVGTRVLAGDLSELIDQVIPHNDPASQQSFHVRPDVATNGSLILFVWQECPLVDNQGNANFCNIGGQFASPGESGLVGVGGNVQVNSGAPQGTINLWPSAAMNAAGSSVVVWIDARTGPQGDIFGQRFDANGQAVGSNFQISTGQGVIWSRPEVALLDDGRFMAMWMDSSSTGFSARHREYDAAGAPMSLPVRLMDEPGAQSGLPAIDRAGTDYAYVWAGVRPGEPVKIYTNKLAAPVSHVPERPIEETGVGVEHYPNPFSGRTTIAFHLDQPGFVTLSVFDHVGREVATLVNEQRAGGRHEISFDAGAFAGGVYLYRLHTAGSVLTGKLVLLK